MPKGPPVHEIFNPPMPGRKAALEYENKESKQQIPFSTKKTLAPLPPMKKFGGYKPKILSGGDDLIPISTNQQQSQPAQQQSPRHRPQLTKPKPFIIGDKDVPMILSVVGDDEDDDHINAKNHIHSKFEEMHIYEEPVFSPNGDLNNKVHNNDMNNNNNNLYSKRIEFDHPSTNNIDSNSHHTQQTQSLNEAFTVTNDLDNLLDATYTKKDPSTFAAENPVFQNTDEIQEVKTETKTEENNVEEETEPEGVFIPVPDYDEDEKSMDFAEEDPDELLEEKRREQQQKEKVLQQRRQPKQQQQAPGVMKVYDGEDLSKYLDDDDDIVRFRENVNMKPVTFRVQQKHSLFKVKTHSTTTTRKTSNKKKAPSFNSVRNFSFADSKYGTRGRAAGKKAMTITEVSGDHDSFLNTSMNGEGGYESFLRSKHGVGLDQPAGGSTDFPQWHGKHGDGIWKKLTVRLRHKIQRNGYDM